MTKEKEPREMSPIQESEDGVATEGEEETSPVRNEYNGKGSKTQDEQEDGEQLTPYVTKCYGHLETLRKRKREQEELVETLVEETFEQMGAIMQEIMRGLQERHAASHTRFEASDDKLTRSLRAHNRTEKKLKMIAAILLREDDAEQDIE